MSHRRKILKETQNIRRASKQDELNNKLKESQKSLPEFGICFDVDGVLARGTIPIPAAKDAFDLLMDDSGDLKVSTCFVTNSLNTNKDKANAISSWFNCQIQPEQMVHAQGPLEVFTQFHHKHCLIVGQGKVHAIAKDLGFTNICTLEQVNEAYPLLDVVDHDNRRRNAQGFQEKDFPRVEAVILLGEPKRWESYLQVLVDLLKTDGKPNKVPETAPETHLPVIACNMDLQFMDRACMPRYGHGAFLLCLEALYKKVTGRELKYTSLVGKPSEITFRYAEHVLARHAQNLMDNKTPIKRLYLIGDTPEVDIVGTNLYQKYVHRLQIRRNQQITDNNNTSKSKEDDSDIDPELPESRNIPVGTPFIAQSVEEAVPVLVCTGVYKKGSEPEGEGDEKNYHGHRDFPYQRSLYQPAVTCDDVLGAIRWIFQREGMLPA